MASSRRSAGTTTRRRPTSTGCAQGDTLTLTYVAQVNDGHGNVDAQNLVITITGTNDQAVLTSANSTGISTTVDKSLGDSSAQNIAAITGSLAFSDQRPPATASPRPPVHPPC